MLSMLNNIRNEVLLINKNLKNLTSFVDADSSVITEWLGCNEDQSISDSLSVEENWVRYFIDVKPSKLCDNKDYSIFLNWLHQDWEVALNIGWHLDLNASLEFLRVGSWVSNFHKVDLLRCLSSFLFTETEYTILVWCVFGNWNVNEATSISFNKLLLSFFCEEELHVCVNTSLVIGVETNEEAPFLWWVDSIRHNLAVG